MAQDHPQISTVVLRRRLRSSSRPFLAFLDPTLPTALLPRPTGFSEYIQNQTQPTHSNAIPTPNSAATGF